MSIVIQPIQNGESGASVRAKLNRMIAAAGDGTIGGVTPEDLENLIDTTPPAVPRGLFLETFYDNGSWLKITWNPNTETDFAYYDLQIREASGNWMSYQLSNNFMLLEIVPAISYAAQVRAVDKSGNASNYSAVETTIGAPNTERPAMPIGLKISAGTESIWVSWDANTEKDLSHYEVYETDADFAPDDGDNPTYVVGGNSFAQSGLDPETTRYYWVRAVNTSGNTSPWSIGVSATTGAVRRQIAVTLTDVTFKPSDGGPNRITWTSGQVNYGTEGQIPTTQNIPAGSAVYSGERVFIRYIIGDTALTTTVSLVDLYSRDSVLVGVYQGGTNFQLVMGKEYIDGGMILAQTIGANQLVANQAVITGTAQIADAIITSAKIVELDAAKLTAGTALAGSITVSGRALSEVSDWAADPAARVNQAETLIEPGRIRIAGSTTLQNWKNGPDSTEINGGSIAANTIRANSVVIGLRGVDIQNIVFTANSPSANFVSWTGGTITYLDNAGNPVTAVIAAGNAPWTSGVRYIYWQQNATTLTVTSSYATALASNAILLATYSGGVALTVNSGRTTIEGSTIKTGTINTDQLAAGAVRADKIAVANLAAIVAQLGHIIGGSMNINNRFIVASDGSVTIQNAASGARLYISNTLIMVFDGNNVLRVRMGIW